MRMRTALAAAALMLAWIAPALAQTASIPSDASSTRQAVEQSANGTTAAVSATLPAVKGQTTYICGFDFFMTNATSANTATNVTVTGPVNTLTFGYPTLAAGATVPNNPHLTIPFTPCQPANGQNTAIVVQGPPPGAGATYTSVNAWGFTVPNF
jgi:hypothetical protein